jgi:DNA polymerase III subunit beta
MQLIIKTNELKALLLCASKNDIRFYLNGVYFEAANGKTIAAATDGHRLLAINLPSSDNGDVKAIIPRALVENAVKTKDMTILITFEGDSVTLASAAQTVSGKLVEGVFPTFRRVVPVTVNGEPAQYENQFLVDFDKVGKLIDGGKASVLTNGGSAALVKYTNENVVGVVMPFRHELPEDKTRPAWIND